MQFEEKEVLLDQLVLNNVCIFPLVQYFNAKLIRHHKKCVCLYIRILGGGNTSHPITFRKCMQFLYSMKLLIIGMHILSEII